MYFASDNHQIRLVSPAEIGRVEKELKMKTAEEILLGYERELDRNSVKHVIDIFQAPHEV